MGRKLRILKDRLRGAANLTANGISSVSEFYWRNKEYMDPAMMVAGGAVIGSSLLTNNLSPLESIITGGIGAGALFTAEKISDQINTPKGRIGSYASAVSLSTLLSSSYLAKFGANNTDAPFLSQMGHNLFDVGCLIVGGYALLKLAQGAYSINHDETYDGIRDPSRREFIKTVAKGTSTMATAAIAWKAAKTLGLYDKIKNIFSKEKYSNGEISFVNKKGMKMVGVYALPEDNYESISSDFLKDPQKNDALKDINGSLKAGKKIYIPIDWLKFKLESIDDTFVDNFSPQRTALWGMAEYWAVPKTETQRKDKIMSNVRIMQRLTNIQDYTKIRDDKSIIIPKGVVYDKRLLSDLSAEQESAIVTKFKGKLSVDHDFLNRVAIPRNRIVGHKKNGARIFAQNPDSIDMLLIHTSEPEVYSNDKNIVAYIKRERLAHFAIGRDGTIYQTVPMDYLAHHAGQSMWDGVDELSYNSIGIELIACRDKRKGLPITEAQYVSLKKLKDYIQAEYKIKNERILGHNQVACAYQYDERGRKGDPGYDFKWKKIGLPEDHYSLLDPDTACGRLGISPKATYQNGNRTKGMEQGVANYKGRRSR